jgi:polyphosphate kinase
LSRKSANIFDELRQHDVLLHHPLRLLRSGGRFHPAGRRRPRRGQHEADPLSHQPRLARLRALIEAAATKEATLVVELMARFDEASNIRWARSMEDAGVQVFHGVVGLKTHCKLAMLVRRDEDGVTRRYCHLGTGNYNPVTARFYTDLSLLTCDPQITERVHMVFNYLTAHAEIDDYRRCWWRP